MENREGIRGSISHYISGLHLLMIYQVWKAVSGVSDFLEANPTFFKSMVMLVFGLKVPSTVRNVPSFGGVVSPSDHYLADDGFNIFIFIFIFIFILDTYIFFLKKSKHRVQCSFTQTTSSEACLEHSCNVISRDRSLSCAPRCW